MAIARGLLGEDFISDYRKKHAKKSVNTSTRAKKLEIKDYDEAWTNILHANWTSEFLPGAFVEWDNTPRNKAGLVYSGFSVNKFERYMKDLVKKARSQGKPAIFVNAWNEWAEGAYLELDEYAGISKLEALKRAIESAGGEK